MCYAHISSYVFLCENRFYVLSSPLPDEAGRQCDLKMSETFRQWFYAELTGSYINIFLLCAIIYLLYKIFRPSSGEELMCIL